LLACVNDLIFEGVDVVRIGFVIGRTIVMMWLIWGTPIPLSKGGPFEAKILRCMDGPNTEVTSDGFKLETNVNIIPNLNKNKVLVLKIKTCKH
jgi:hypothetical protein